MDALLLEEKVFERKKEEKNEWIRYGCRLAVSATLHPFEQAKVLMQLGFEPLAAAPANSMFGKPVMVLPNIFEYVAHIYQINGIGGCYRGVIPKILGSVLSMVCSERIADYFGLLEPVPKSGFQFSSRHHINTFLYTLKRDLVLSVTSIVVAQPFRVISLRMMAQFIGQENIYYGIIPSVKVIYQTEGVRGLFAGIVPLMCFDVLCVVLTNTSVYLINKYIVKDRFERHYNSGFMQFLISTLLYPLQVVSTCMAVTGSHLIAGRPPVMPVYVDWIDCWNDLQARGELKRANSFFWRSVAVMSKSELPRLSWPLNKLH